MGRRRKHRKKRNRPQGFSAPGQRQIWDFMFRSTGTKGKHKRQYFNQLSAIMVLSASIACCVVGFVWFGFLGAIVGFAIGATLMGNWVTKNRYYR